MDPINWTSPEVVSALISAAATIVAAIIAAICAALIGKMISGRKRLLEQRNEAIRDIAFLLAVEEEHIKIHQMGDGESYKRQVRAEATSRGLTWSGRYTPGRAKVFLNNDATE